MMLEIIKVLIALPPSMVAAVMLYHLVRPGKGKHREKDQKKGQGLSDRPAPNTRGRASSPSASAHERGTAEEP